MYRFTIAVCLTILICLAGVSLAGIPRLINYQGMLTDDIGDPITDTLDLDFRIYNAPSGGTLKWSETLTQVPVINGLFNVMLGTETDLVLDFSEPYWLEVDVGGEIMSRLQFTSVGYAYRAERADTAQYARVGGSGDSDWDVVGSILFTHGAWGIARDGNTVLGDFDYTHVNLGVSCSTGASGEDNRCCTVGGGLYNAAGGQYATVGGGYENSADTSYATVGGGRRNTAGGYYATIGGGNDNSADISSATVGGGYNNSASGTFATVGGGWSNIASGDAATVGGGSHNSAIGNFSFAAGVRARANHHGSFVWADGLDIDFNSTGDNQFLIRASGGVGIGVTNPEEMLEIENATANQRVFLKIQASHPTEFEEVGIRLETPQNRWHLRMDDHSNDNLPDVGSLALRSQNSGIEVTTWTNDGRVGIATTTPQQRLDVNGIARIRSWATTPTYDVQVNNNGDLCRVSSSKRYKKNIRELESHLDKILDLKPVSFEWRTTSERHVGLIAEDVHELIPELVGYDKEGRPDAVRYELVSLYLLEAMKELKAENEELKQRIEALEGQW